MESTANAQERGSRRKGGGNGEDRKNRFQAFINPTAVKICKENNLPVPMHRKMSMAMERNSRVMMIHNQFSHLVINIQQQNDRALQIMSNRLLKMPDPAVGLMAFSKWKEAVKKFDDESREFNQAVGLAYTSPLDTEDGGKDNGKKGKSAK